VKSSTIEIQYHTKRQLERIRSFELEIECLDNLDQTIDQVFKYLEDVGNPQALEELCPYFGVIWPSARGLAQFLSDLPQSALSNKNVLELGCGLALPSMLASKIGAQVIATDFHPEVPGFLKTNIQKNQLENLNYRAVNWEVEMPNFEKFDWVIGSDVLYEKRYAESLAKTIDQLVKPDGKVLIADPGRPYLQSFVDAMKSFGFQERTTILKVPHPPQMQEVFVLSFQKLPFK
jgi:predicted nicotinamide N-methyase